jgi:outer membrane lipoprotein-sorting protein
MPPLRLLAAALVVPSLGLSACTQTEKSSVSSFQGEQRAVAQTLEDLQKAGSDRDGTKICEHLLTRSLVQKIQQSSKTDCPKAVGDRLSDVDSFDLTVKQVQISGNSATATVNSAVGSSKDRVDRLRLVRDGRNWKVDSLG